jgi:hypothetical protein
MLKNPEIIIIFLLLALVNFTQSIPVPFNPIIEKGLRVLSMEMEKKGDFYLFFNVTFLAMENAHISWGNYSLADQDGNNSTVLPMYITGNPSRLLNEYPISKGQTYKIQL